MLTILKKNPFPKFHVSSDNKISLFVKERRIPVNVTLEDIYKYIPKRQRRMHDASNGITICTGVIRDGNSVMLHDITESEKHDSFRFQRCMNGYTYRFYSGRTVTISPSCGAELFKQDNPIVSREEIIAYLVKRNYGIEI